MKQICDFNHDTHMQLRILPFGSGNIHVCHEHYQQEITYRKNQGHGALEASFFGPIFPTWTELGIYYPPYNDVGKIISLTNIHLTKEKTYPYTKITGISDHSQIWAALYAVAAPIVQHYHSDLYHDAREISTFDHTLRPFWYGVGDCGTHIYQDYVENGIMRSGRELAMNNRSGRPYIYHCMLISEEYSRDVMQFLVIEIASPKEK